MDWFALFPSYFARESKLASDKKSLFAHAQSEKLIWLSCHYCKNWKSNWKSKKKIVYLLWLVWYMMYLYVYMVLLRSRYVRSLKYIPL